MKSFLLLTYGCSPIFAEIVPRRARTSIYALDSSFESILSSFSPPLVGILAQHVYGYKPLPAAGPDGSRAIEVDRENAASLGKALYSAISIPMAICCALYSFLYCTYPRDRDRARMEALIESEMHEIETEKSGLVEEQAQLHVSEYGVKGRSVIDVDYEGEGSLDFDENEEQRLLSRELIFSDMGKL